MIFNNITIFQVKWINCWYQNKLLETSGKATFQMLFLVLNKQHNNIKTFSFDMIPSASSF